MKTKCSLLIYNKANLHCILLYRAIKILLYGNRAEPKSISVI